jgi:hypothetical protein
MLPTRRPTQIAGASRPRLPRGSNALGTRAPSASLLSYLLDSCTYTCTRGLWHTSARPSTVHRTTRTDKAHTLAGTKHLHAYLPWTRRRRYRSLPSLKRQSCRSSVGLCSCKARLETQHARHHLYTMLQPCHRAARRGETPNPPWCTTRIQPSTSHSPSQGQPPHANYPKRTCHM